MRIPLSELVGKDVKGRKAIATAREHYYLYPDGVPVHTLIAVETYKEKYTGTSGPHRFYRWYRVRWQKQNGMMDCGFSGYREDCNTPVTLEFVD